MKSTERTTLEIPTLFRIAIPAVLFAACVAWAQDSATRKVAYTIDPSNVLNRIDEKIYGHFFEHIYHSANGGFRPDLLDAVAQIQPTIIRWPGGCFASPYRWKDAIGPQHARRVIRREMWDDLDTNCLGVDEFIALCRKVGAEPLLVVNIGTPEWNADAATNDFLQDALDWIEYCNGPADSTWGKVRAANGHREPYNVKYWEIDNETWGFGLDNYIAAVKKFAPAMRRKDPSIKLAACGSAGLRDDKLGLSWNRGMIKECADLVDYLSIHHYEEADLFAQGPYNYERFFHWTADLIAQSANPKLKIYCSEWNAHSIDWRTGLVRAESASVRIENGVMQMTLPALSAAVVTIEL